jgi:hypothetical protein
MLRRQVCTTPVVATLTRMEKSTGATLGGRTEVRGGQGGEGRRRGEGGRKRRRGGRGGAREDILKMFIVVVLRATGPMRAILRMRPASSMDGVFRQTTLPTLGTGQRMEGLFVLALQAVAKTSILAYFWGFGEGKGRGTRSVGKVLLVNKAGEGIAQRGISQNGKFNFRNRSGVQRKSLVENFGDTLRRVTEGTTTPGTQNQHIVLFLGSPMEEVQRLDEGPGGVFGAKDILAGDRIEGGDLSPGAVVEGSGADDVEVEGLFQKGVAGLVGIAEDAGIVGVESGVVGEGVEAIMESLIQVGPEKSMSKGDNEETEI